MTEVRACALPIFSVCLDQLPWVAHVGLGRGQVAQPQDRTHRHKRALPRRVAGVAAVQPRGMVSECLDQLPWVAHVGLGRGQVVQSRDRIHRIVGAVPRRVTVVAAGQLRGTVLECFARLPLLAHLGLCRVFAGRHSV